MSAGAPNCNSSCVTAVAQRHVDKWLGKAKHLWYTFKVKYNMVIGFVRPPTNYGKEKQTADNLSSYDVDKADDSSSRVADQAST